VGVASLIGLAVSAVAAGAVAAVSWRDHARVATWARLARRRHATRLEVSRRRFLATTRMELHCDDGDARLLMDMKASPGRPLTTRVRATFVVGHGPRFKIAAAGPVAGGGLADVAIGNAAFDHAFDVAADDAAAVRKALTPAACAALLALRFARVTSDGKTITLEDPRLLASPALLDAALAAVGELARYDVGMLDVMRAFPGARWHPPRGSWDERSVPHVELEGGLQLGTIDLGPRAVAYAAAPAPRGLAPFRFVVEGGRIEGDPPPGLDAARLGDCTVRVEGGQVVLLWSELEVDALRLAAGVDLLRAVTAQTFR
jgi:hypothetical protein